MAVEIQESTQALLDWLARRMREKSPLERRMEDACERLRQHLQMDSWTFMCARRGDAFGKLQYRQLENDWDSNTSFSSRRIPLDGEVTSSSALFAMSEAQPIVIANLTKETRFNDPVISHLRVSSGIVAPLLVEGTPYGVIGVWSEQPQAYQREHVQLVQNAASLVSTAAAHQRLADDLEEAQRLYDTTVNSMSCYLLVLDSGGHVLASNRRVEKGLGFTEDELLGRSIFSTLLTPNSTIEFDDCLIDMQRTDTQLFEWTGEALTRVGKPRMIQWSMGKMEGGRGGAFTLIATGIDVTEQLEMRDNLSRVESRAEDMKRTADELQTQAEISRSVRAERRASPRRPYPYIQSIAPQLDPDSIPPAHAFFAVRCRDISPDGFSFITYERPTFERVVVSFGAPPSQILVSARIAHVTACSDLAQNALVVGCDYLGRVRNETIDHSSATLLDARFDM